MEWSKAKNIILIVLILANGFLIINIVSVFIQTDGVEREMRELALHLLTTQGHTVEETALNNLPRIAYSYYQTRDSKREDEIARLALGEYKKEIRGGGIVEYTSDAGRFSFRNGGVFIGELNGVDASEDIVAAAEAILKNTKIFQGKLQEINGKIIGVQKIEGSFEIEDFTIEVEQNTRGIKISGRYFDEKNAQKIKSNWDTARLIVGLNQVIGESRTVQDMQLIYSCENSTAEGSLFVPVLKVTLVGETVYLNGNTGMRMNY